MGPLKSAQFHSSSQSRLLRAVWDGFWRYLSIEIPQLLWTTRYQVWSRPFPLMLIQNFCSLWFIPAASCPVTGHHWEECGSVFFPSSFQIFIDIDKVLPRAFSSPGQPVSSLSAFPHRRMLKFLHYLSGGSFLDSLQSVWYWDLN